MAFYPRDRCSKHLIGKKCCWCIYPLVFHQIGEIGEPCWEGLLPSHIPRIAYLGLCCQRTACCCLPLTSQCSHNTGWLWKDASLNLNVSSLPPYTWEDHFVISLGRRKEESSLEMKEEWGKMSYREYFVFLLWTLGRDTVKTLKWYFCMLESKELKFNSLTNSLNFLKTNLRI